MHHLLLREKKIRIKKKKKVDPFFIPPSHILRSNGRDEQR